MDVIIKREQKMEKLKKIFLKIIFVIILILILFTAWLLVVSISMVREADANVGLEWTITDEENIATVVVFTLIAGIAILFEILLLFFMIKIIKKIRRKSNSKFLRLK